MPKTYRVAVIGHTGRGDYGHGLDQMWASVPNTEVVAVADADPTGLAAAGKLLSLDRMFSDYRRMLDEMKPDIACVGLRYVDQHRDMVVAAAERGIHVFMEKPFCRSMAEADQIIETCERTHARLVIAHPTRYSPKADMVNRMIAEGKIGRVLEYRGRGKEDVRGGAEDLCVLGTHIMDLIRMFGGHPQWCFGVVTQGDHPLQSSDIDDGPEGLGPLGGDYVRAMFGMPDGSTTYFGSRKNAATKGARFALQIYGSAGILEIQTGYSPSVKYLADPTWSPGRSTAQWQDLSPAPMPRAGQTKQAADDADLHAGNATAAKDLLAAIEENREPKGGMYEARGALEMIQAVFESQRVGGPVTLPLKNRQNPLSMLS